MKSGVLRSDEAWRYGVVATAMLTSRCGERFVRPREIRKIIEGLFLSRELCRPDALARESVIAEACQVLTDAGWAEREPVSEARLERERVTDAQLGYRRVDVAGDRVSPGCRVVVVDPQHMTLRRAWIHKPHDCAPRDWQCSVQGNLIRVVPRSNVICETKPTADELEAYDALVRKQKASTEALLAQLQIKQNQLRRYRAETTL